ncbi:DUF1289 domain-containing protein [uncultured Psychrosphaera sp.]|uniref:DUF1289 domain-containing protein n=1 Tax=uncultured Psychrosphaera sp. TaxID=1403522 RepID=UPI0030FD0BF5
MIESPCIRQCCLDDNDICCGCYRHITEITGWQKLTIDEKENVLSRCDMRKKNHTFTEPRK